MSYEEEVVSKARICIVEVVVQVKVLKLLTRIRVRRNVTFCKALKLYSKTVFLTSECRDYSRIILNMVSWNSIQFGDKH